MRAIGLLGCLLLGLSGFPTVAAHLGPLPLDVRLERPTASGPSTGIIPDDPWALQLQEHRPSPPWDSDLDGGSPYGLRFKCPTKTLNDTGGQEIVDGRTCPMVLIDVEDILSQPRLLIDPKSPSLMVFNALHGGRGLHPLGPTPPSERSRYNALHQPHTTFQSAEEGARWHDNPYYAPEYIAGGLNSTVFGEDNAAGLDQRGQLYIASLYANRYSEDPPGQYDYSIGLWKMDRINRPINYFQSVGIEYLPDHRAADSLHMVYVRDTERVLVFWREFARTGGGNDTGPGTLHVLWSGADGSSGIWEQTSAYQQVACRETSNPLVVGPLVYFACLPDKGYVSANVSFEQVQMHVLDTRTWETQWVGPTPFMAGHLLLEPMSEEGHMFLVSSGLEGDTSPFLKVSFGSLGARWSAPQDFASKFTNPERDSAVHFQDARVTAAAYTRQTGYVHLLYLEHYVGQTDPLGAKYPTLYKTYGVVRQMSGFQGLFKDLGYGTEGSRYRFSVAYQGGAGEDVFDDLHDSIVAWTHPRTHKERIFVAFGDHGVVRFAEVVERNVLPPLPLPPLNVPPIPLAAAGSNPAMNSAIAGLLFGLMLLRMLAARRKAASTVKA